MNKTQPFETKSIYLAFALCPCLSSNTYLDRDSGKFHFELLKGNFLSKFLRKYPDLKDNYIQYRLNGQG